MKDSLYVATAEDAGGGAAGADGRVNARFWRMWQTKDSQGPILESVAHKRQSRPYFGECGTYETVEVVNYVERLQETVSEALRTQVEEQARVLLDLKKVAGRVRAAEQVGGTSLCLCLSLPLSVSFSLSLSLSLSMFLSLSRALSLALSLHNGRQTVSLSLSPSLPLSRCSFRATGQVSENWNATDRQLVG